MKSKFAKFLLIPLLLICNVLCSCANVVIPEGDITPQKTGDGNKLQVVEATAKSNDGEQVWQPEIIDLDADNSGEQHYDESETYDYTNVSYDRIFGGFNNEDGVYRATIFASSAICSANANPFTSGTISCTVSNLQNVSGALNDTGIYFGVKLDDNGNLFGNGSESYFFFINEQGYVALGKYSGESYQAIYALQPFKSISSDESHTLKVVIEGRKVAMYVDNTLYCAVKLQNTLVGTAYGFHGRGVGATISNFTVTSDLLYNN